MKRETCKYIALKGRKFRIDKFDALTGSYIAYKLMAQMLPGGLDKQISDKMPKGRTVMSKEEFVDLQRDCLAVCKEIVTAGGNEMPMPVVMANGSWGVAGLEDDTITVMTLTINALVFNVAGFFEGDALKELTQSLSGISLYNAKT